MNHPKSQLAFTIVELMVVMVMIVIIASTLYFILSGWRTETARTEVQNDLKNMAAELQQYSNFNNGYPSAISSLTYDRTATVTVNYVLRTDGTYCANAASIPESLVTYNIDSRVSTEPAEGLCTP